MTTALVDAPEPDFDLFDEYQGWVESRMSESMRGDPQGHGIPTFSQGLSGEAGELLEFFELELERLLKGVKMMRSATMVTDRLKKHLGHKHPIDLDKLELELGDLLWYIVAICIMFGTTLKRCAVRNRLKLLKRYIKTGGMLTPEQSFARDETEHDPNKFRRFIDGVCVHEVYAPHPEDEH